MNLPARLLVRASAAALRHPGRTLWIWTAVCAAAIGLAAARVEMRTSNLDLIDPELPPVKRFLDVANEFGTPNVLVLALSGAAPERLEAAVDRVAPLIRAKPGVRTVVDRLPLEPGLLRELGLPAYMHARDRSQYYLFIQPSDPSSSVTALDPFVAAVKDAVRASGVEGEGIRTGTTGIPQYALDDRDVIQRDTTWLTFLSFGLIFLLFRGCFGRFRRPLAAMGALVAGVVATAGLIAFYPGHLTLLSASFASTLFGLGVDYGIHIVNRLEELLEHGVEADAALARSVSDIAPDITTGALTTAGVFASLAFCGFRGFEELGLIAAMGVLVCLVAMCTVLPALLRLFPGAPAAAAPRRNRIGNLLVAGQRPVVLLATLAATAALALQGSPGFDTDYLDLQPVDSPTVRLEREMERGSDYSALFALFVADSAEHAARLGQRLLSMPEVVADVRSAAELEAAAPGEGLVERLPQAYRDSLISRSGHHAVYVYPEGNVWDPAVQRRFVAAMQAVDPGVTGMPVLGEFLTGRSREALRRSIWIGLPILMLLVLADFRHPLWALIALTPTLLTFVALPGWMTLCDLPFNPLNMMALPIVLGIAVDDGVHITHRFRSDGSTLRQVLLGSGRSVYLTSATTVAAFGSLALTRHRGLRSFSVTLCSGVIMAFLLSVFLLPALLGWAERRGWLRRAVPSVPAQ